MVVVRLVERWRVTPSAASHRIVILGQRVSYPAANVAAIVVLGLAVLGAVVVGLALVGAIREVTRQRRLSRRLAARSHCPERTRSSSTVSARTPSAPAWSGLACT